jgi:hypothetical protein
MATRLRLKGYTRLAAALLAATLARAASADANLDMWQAQRNTFETFISHMKVLDKHHVAEVMQVTVENRFLVVRTPLNTITAEESMRVPLEDVHGSAVIAINREDNGAGGGDLNRFTLSIMDFPAPKISSTINLSESSHPDDITISRTIQSTGGAYNQIIFTQRKGIQSNGGDGIVQLAISTSRGQNLAPEALNVESRDFYSFTQEHPDQTEQYVRPLLRDLGQESVFAPDETIAWQVFSELWKPDAKVIQRVHQLLPSLNSDDYRIRNEALVELLQTGRDGAAVLIHLDRATLSPEQNARIDRALTRYAQLPTKEAARLGSDPRFLLDCLYSDDASLRRSAFDRLRSVIRPDLQFDVDALPATRSAAVAALRNQLLPSHPQPLN